MIQPLPTRLLRSEIKRLSMTEVQLDQLRVNLKLTVDEFVRLLMNELEITPQIASQLEDHFRIPADIWLGYSNPTRKAQRGGKRKGSGRKKTGHVTRLIRISASPEDMLRINNWITSNNRVAHKVATYILENI
jgi:plasmid maintenance system antidote protein VapI